MTFLNALISSSSFIVYSLRFSNIKYHDICDKDSITSFPSLIPLIYFSCFITQARIFSTVLNRNNKNRYPCRVLDLRQKVFIKFFIKYGINCRFSQKPFIRLRKLLSQFSEFLLQIPVKLFQMIFSHLLRRSFYSSNMMNIH